VAIGVGLLLQAPAVFVLARRRFVEDEVGA
jgi:hypothetical protein